MKPLFAQQDHMQLVKFLLQSVLMAFRSGICLLLNVIRLAGWLKHCHLPLSQL